MRRVRIERKLAKVSGHRGAVLPFDPRDADVVGAKDRARALRDRG